MRAIASAAGNSSLCPPFHGNFVSLTIRELHLSGSYQCYILRLKRCRNTLVSSTSRGRKYSVFGRDLARNYNTNERERRGIVMFEISIEVRSHEAWKVGQPTECLVTGCSTAGTHTYSQYRLPASKSLSARLLWSSSTAVGAGFRCR